MTDNVKYLWQKGYSGNSVLDIPITYINGRAAVEAVPGGGAIVRMQPKGVPATGAIVKMSGDQVIEPFTTLTYELFWNTPIDFDIGVFYEYSDVPGTYGITSYWDGKISSQIPYIWLDLDAGIGDVVDPGGNYETIQFEENSFDFIRKAWVIAWDYGGRHDNASRFNGSGATVRLYDDLDRQYPVAYNNADDNKMGMLFARIIIGEDEDPNTLEVANLPMSISPWDGDTVTIQNALIAMGEI